MLQPIKFFIIIFAFILTIACETQVQSEKFPSVTFVHLAPIKLNVSQIDVVVQYRPPLRAPNVEHFFPTQPTAAIKRWAKDRLRAVGASGKAQLVILNASAIEKQLLTKKNLVSTFINQQNKRYDATVHVRLDISNVQGQGTTEAHTTRFTTVRENITINKRNRIWFDLTETLLQEFNTVMEEKIRKHLSVWLR